MDIHDIFRPLLTYFRSKRMRMFYWHYPIRRNTRVLDVGGDLFNWRLLPGAEIPKLTMANIRVPSHPEIIGDEAEWVVADGRQLPFGERAFEIVYSNSVIEHLGAHSDQAMFAQECKRVGRTFFVQTPNRYFPVEPHYLTPFMHWLPRKLRRLLARNFTIWGLVTRPSEAECRRMVDEIRLLGPAELLALFPDSIIFREKVLGWTKSLIAVSKRTS